MKTRNERIQKVLTGAIINARAAGMPKASEDAYCAAYLARIVADMTAASPPPVEDPEALKQWLLDNPDHLYATLADLDRYELLDLIHQPAALGAYVLMQLQDQMRYEQDFAYEDTAAEDDMRQRVRDMTASEKEWLGVG